ncbi:MAG: hypothetical protein AAF322_18105, partial [Pseudomonadota bacterium]
MPRPAKPRYEWVVVPDAPRPSDDPYVAWAEATGESFVQTGAAAPPRTPGWVLNPPRPAGAEWSAELAAEHLAGFAASHARPAGDARPAPLREASVPVAGRAPCDPPTAAPPSPAKGRRLIVLGIMDDAFNLAHLRFRGPDGACRIDYAWVMDGTAQAASAVPFGREWTGAEIAAAVSAASDEAAALRTLELEDARAAETMAAAKRVHHGTHMLDLAAGFEPDDPDGVEIRIVAVQLPRGVILDASGAMLTPFAVAGLRYIEARAALIAAACGATTPLIVNFSYGLGAGPHNGGHPVERALEDMTGPRAAGDPLGPVHAVMPAGNRYRMDAHGAATADESG